MVLLFGGNSYAVIVDKVVQKEDGIEQCQMQGWDRKMVKEI